MSERSSGCCRMGGAVRSRRLLVLALWVVVLGSVHCHGAPPRQPSPMRAPAAALLVAQHLPPDTAALAVVVDGYGLIDRLGRREIIAEHRAAFERILFETVAETDHDLLSVEGLREVGIEPHGVFGAAWLGPVAAGTVLFIPLADANRFKVALVRYGLRKNVRFKPTVRQGAVLLSAPSEESLALVIYEHKALVVLSHGSTPAAEMAAGLAELPQSESLAGTDRCQGALRGLGAGDLVAYVDPAAVLRHVVGLDPRWHGRSVQEAAQQLELGWRKALARGRARGDTVEQLVATDDSFFEARRLLRQDPEANRMRRLIGGLGAAALSLDVLDNGIRIRGRVGLEPSSLLGRVLRKRAEPPVLVRALERRPSLLVQTSVDPRAVIELAGALGAPLGELSKSLDVDLEAQLQAVLSGPIEVALTQQLRLAREEGGGMLDDPGVHLVVGLRDPAGARRLLDQVMSAGPLEGLAQARPGGDGYVLKLPGVRPAHLRIVGQRLVAAPDPGWIDRLESQERTAWSGTGHQMLRRLSSTDDASLDGGLALGQLWATHMSYRAAYANAALSLPVERGEKAGTGQGADGHEPAMVPTAAIEVKRLELERLEQRIETLRTRMQRRSWHRGLTFARQLGLLGLKAVRTERGFELTGAWVVGDRDITGLLVELLDLLPLGRELGSPAEPEAAAELWDLLQELLDERERLREQLADAPAQAPSSAADVPEASQAAP